MNPGQVRVLIDKYEVLLKKTDEMQRAVEYSKESDAKTVLMIGTKKGTNRHFSN